MTPTPEALEALKNVQKQRPEAASRAGRLLIDRLTAEDYLGSGVEKVVFDVGGGKAAAFFIEQPWQGQQLVDVMKSYYYSGKLAHLLLPDNIPDVHLAGSQPPVIITDKVIEAGPPVDLAERHAFRRQLLKLGMEAVVDLAEGNILRDVNNQLVYVDIVTPAKMIYNPELNAYIESLLPTVRKRARRLQSRLADNPMV